jgi:phage terminase small subunit
MKRVRKLTPKRRLFALEFLACGNASEAARRAGYSAKTAGSQAHDLLKKPEVASFLAERQGKREQQLVLEVERMDELLDDVQNAVLTDAYNDDGTLKLPHEFPDRLKRAVTKIKSKELFNDDGKLIGFTREVAVEGKTPAIRLGYQRRGVLVEKHEVTVRTHAELVAEAARRAREARDVARGVEAAAGSTH